MGIRNHYFKFNARSVKDFGAYVSGADTFISSAPNIESKSVPGRNGDLLISDGAYKNISVSYTCQIIKDFETNFRSLAAWLFSEPGYKRLEDTYHPEYFRLGSAETALDADMTALNREGEFKVTFNCKPQMFLLSGETPIILTGSDTITNPTMYKARPMIRAYPTSTAPVTLVFNDTVTVTVNNVNNLDYIDIDCEIGEAYFGSTNCNDQVSFVSTSSDDLPYLKAGDNVIACDGDAEITPRWWTI